MSQVVSKSILVIGTDLHFCYLMRRYIHESDRPFLLAHPGEDTLSRVLNEKPALIILEAETPETKNYQILRELKSNLSTAQVPVILCSWNDDETRGLAEGANLYLRMPILYGDFLATLNNLGV